MSDANIAILTLTVSAAGALAACRFVTEAGAYPAVSGDRAFGVTRTSAGVAGDLVPVDIQGTATVECGAAVTAGQAVQADATGRIVPLVATKAAVGRALEAGAVNGIIEILLVPTA